MEYVNWIKDNWTGISAALVALYTLATVVVNLTPTETDNKVLAKIHSIAARFGLDLTKRELKAPEAKPKA